MQALSLISKPQRVRLMIAALAVSAAGVCASIAQAQPADGPQRREMGERHRRERRALEQPTR